MRERVVAYLVPFAVDTFQQAGIALRGNADQEERRLGVLLLQHVENLRRVLRVGAVIKGNSHLLGLESIGLELVRIRQLGELFGGNEPGTLVERQRTASRTRTMGD